MQPYTAKASDSAVYTAITGDAMTCEINSYDIGNEVSLTVQFSDAYANPVDPTTVILRIQNPDASVTVLTYGVDPVTKNGTGSYAYAFTPTQTGDYFYRWEGSGNFSAAVDNQFSVSTSNVLD